MFHLRWKPVARARQRQHSRSILVLEKLEDRVVLIANGTLIVPTQPSPTGLIGVDPTNGSQTQLMGGVNPIDPQGLYSFVNPQEVVEAPSRMGFSILPPQLYITDGGAGTGGLGAVFEYDPYSSKTVIVAQGGLMKTPIALAFLNGYLYVANCADKTLVRLNPNNAWHQDYVNVTLAPGRTTIFDVVTDLKRVQGSSNAIYLVDEGGFIYQSPVNGQIWKLTFSDSLHATETAFGPPFPYNDQTYVDFSHPQGLTADLSNPSSVDPIVVSASYNGNYDTLVIVHPSSFTVLAQDDRQTFRGYLKGANGIAMGSGRYGSNTIFIPTIPTDNGPAKVTALVENGTGVTDQTPLSTGNNLSTVSGPCIYHSSGGSAAAPPAGPHSPAPLVIEDNPYPTDFMPQGPLAGATSSPVPSATVVDLPSQMIPLPGVEELRLGTAPPGASQQASVQDTAVNSLFADWSALLLVGFEGWLLE